MPPIHLFAVLVAAVVAFIIGFLFHGPLFGKLWMKLADVHPTGNEKLSDMVPQMFWNLVSNFVTAFALAVVYGYTVTSSLSRGAGIGTAVMSAFWVWFGFLVTSSSIEVIWMKRKTSLWLFECVSSLVVMIAMGIIIAVL